MSSLHFRRDTKTPSEAAEDTIDIDVTPVMNMFIILIPFLVSVAVFTHMSILDFSLPQNVNSSMAKSDNKPELKLTVLVDTSYVALTLGDRMLDSLSSADNLLYEKLDRQLKERRSLADQNNRVVVASRDAVRFQNVVRIMDACRAAGFEQVGLSSAPDQAQGGEL
ncbi:MAG: ExbD/TolR family protein [Chitinivibrionales bacterium]